MTLKNKLKTEILQREGFDQGDAFEAACSGVACEAQGRETDVVAEELPVLLLSVVASASPFEDVESRVYLSVNHSSGHSEQPSTHVQHSETFRKMYKVFTAKLQSKK